MNNLPPPPLCFHNVMFAGGGRDGWLRRVEEEKAEAKRLAAEKEAAKRRKDEAARVEAEKKEAERVEAERVEAARREAARLAAARVEAERVEAERREAARKEAARVEAERVEAARLEAERRFLYDFLSPILEDEAEAKRVAAALYQGGLNKPSKLDFLMEEDLVAEGVPKYAARQLVRNRLHSPRHLQASSSSSSSSGDVSI